jgi:hypothetical protein
MLKHGAYPAEKKSQLQNRFVIRDAQTFNAQKAFGKNSARQAFNV